MSFLMEHYELTVNLVVCTNVYNAGMPSFYFIVLGLGSCKSKLYYLYGFWEMKAVLVFFRLFYYPLLCWGGSNVCFPTY